MHRSLKGQTVLVVGPGWLGGPAADALLSCEAGVWTLQRQRDGGTDGADPEGSALPARRDVYGDIRDIQQNAPAPSWQEALPPQLDHLVVCIAPSRALGDTHQSTYPVALHAAMTLADRLRCRSILYTSSTGVYGRTDGGWSRESDPLPTTDARQDALREAERQLSDRLPGNSIGRTILRVAGLYGPGRDPSPRFALIPSASEDVWCNFSWRDDVVSAILHFLVHPAPAGSTRIFNCADGSPMRASAIARALGATQHSGDGRSMSRSNQRVSTEAIRQAGWSPSMPSVLEGLAALGHVVSRDFDGGADA